MLHLPPTEELKRRCRALAALDLILSPDWQGRFYSFNARWSEKEQMASMRNGCGDEWWFVFHESGWAALKGLGHESPAWSRHGQKLSAALKQAFPGALKDFASEPAFRWDETSFAWFHEPSAVGWTRANDLTGYATDAAGDDQLLAHVVGEPSDYAAFATDYFETDIAERIVAEIFALRPITPAIVKSLNPSTTLPEISAELFGEIQYPSAGLGTEQFGD
jgi:hypothetical protein